ncbi:MAG: hypothetical protein HY042_11680 [Spirochaetia bacterium]|nr:hypothetical protein [Spirochaetia bacterium]
MNEVTIFALTLLAVPVFARFARVKPDLRRLYHMIGLGGLFLILSEGTRLIAGKIAVLGLALPVMDPVLAVFAYVSILMGTILVSLYFLRHWKEEIHI